jgi:hypothetical protein
MSRYGIEKACHDLADESNQKLFREGPDRYLDRYPLTPAERELVKHGDVGALFVLEVNGGALSELMRFFNYSMVEYVTRLRGAVGLPEDEGQLKILRERDSRRRKPA